MPGSDKAATLAALEAGYQGFRAKIAGLPEQAYSEVWLGDWSLDQLLAHMAGWYGEMTAAIERVGRGERPTPAGVDYGDFDTWNAKFARNAKHGKAALEQWDAGYAKYRDAARALPDSSYGVDAEKGRPRIGNRLLEGAGIEHFEEHGHELEAWLASRK